MKRNFYIVRNLIIIILTNFYNIKTQVRGNIILLKNIEDCCSHEGKNEEKEKEFKEELIKENNSNGKC